MGPMLDHLSIGVADLATSQRFYDKALKPLGYRRVMDFKDAASGYGVGPQAPQFWLNRTKRSKASPGAHIAFSAGDRKSVRAFHRAALKAGGRDNGRPGLRPEYHPTYYGAFVIDPDGHHVEAVCHFPE